MCDSQNNVQLSWQLVSQFVSWDFCRYMCEQNENSISEVDVLTFLRNMIVQRTEKSISDITKHEIIAKFIMETKAVQDISRMPCIIALSESVKRICPELEPAVSKAVDRLETFLSVLDSNEEQFKEELIRLRINDAIADFSKEASKLLPQPELLQVIGSWNHHHGHKKPSKKVVYSAALFEKVLECLHFESVTPSEAKLIALSLHEDKKFERILQNAEAESETEADSEQFSLSIQSSQPNENLYSQEFLKSTQSGKVNEIPPSNAPPNPDSLELDDAIQAPQELPTEAPHRTHELECVLEEHPPPIPVATSSVPSPNRNYHVNWDIPENDENFGLPNETDSGMQFAQSSAKESESDDAPTSLHIRVTSKYKDLNANRISTGDSHSDSDTSDCEKNAEYRFLTPTMYKNGANSIPARKTRDVVWLSDQSSNDSSILTPAINSQKDDPNWSSTSRPPNYGGTNINPAHNIQGIISTSNLDSDDSSFINAIKSRGSDSHWSLKSRPKNCKTANKVSQKTSKKATHKKKVPILSDTDSSDAGDQNCVNNNGSEPDSPGVISASDHDRERPPKKRRLAKKLYRSPNISINDFVQNIRKPNPVISNEVPVHRGTNTPSVRKSTTPQPQKKSTRRQKCKQCNKSYKTAIALRRHVFLKHTSIPQGESGSDCDD